MIDYPPVRIQIRKVDRNEFTPYRWGEYENGEIKRRFDEGESRFGPFDEFVERALSMMQEDANPSYPLNWLFQWPDYGTMAQSPKAYVVHKDLDRIFGGMQAYSAAGALQGLEHPDSTCKTIHVLEVGHPDPETGEPTLRLQFDIGEFEGTANQENAESLEKAAYTTVKNILRFVRKADQFRTTHYEVFDDLVDISIVSSNIIRHRLKIDTESLSQIKFESIKNKDIREEAARVFDFQKGWMK